MYYIVSNLLNIAWIVTFTLGTVTGTAIASLILILVTLFLLLTWVELGKVFELNRNIWVYIMRNIFAFKLGWLFIAILVNVGIDMVYWWNMDKRHQLMMFWLLVPLSVIGFITFAVYRERKFGFLSSLSFWVSAAWATLGSAVASNYCLN